MYDKLHMRLFNWNAVKNQSLIETRGVSFEEVLFFLQNGGLLDDLRHPNSQDYPNQSVFVVALNDYAYLVPYVESDSEIFLKTIIPSRKLTKRYLRSSES